MMTIAGPLMSLNNDKLVYLVYEWADDVESIWDDKQKAEKRLAELQIKNGKDFGGIIAFKLNKPEGFIFV